MPEELFDICLMTLTTKSTISMKSKERYLIDTHVFLWVINSSNRLSQVARSHIAERSNQIFLSKASYWEICLKVSKGTLEVEDGWIRAFERERKANRFAWLEIEPKHCDQLINLPHHHKDPFDRILISQCLSEGLSMISCDEKFRHYDLDVKW